jgi:hypothetical protein
MNIGTKIIKDINNISFLKLVYLFRKKNGAIILNSKKFFSLKYIILRLFKTSFEKDLMNKSISEFET